jgi:hypothetical protein
MFSVAFAIPNDANHTIVHIIVIVGFYCIMRYRKGLEKHLDDPIDFPGLHSFGIVLAFPL